MGSELLDISISPENHKPADFGNFQKVRIVYLLVSSEEDGAYGLPICLVILKTERQNHPTQIQFVA